MPSKIAIPTALRPYTGGAAVVEVEGGTVAEALGALTTTHPKLASHLRDGSGKIRSFVNIYLNDEDIRYLDQLDTRVKEGDSVSILPALAGGGR